jgi:hypothetical protein
MVMYDRFKNFGKVVENQYGSIVSDRRMFPFFKNRDDDSMFPQFGKNILGQTEIENKLENRYKDFRTTFYNETGNTIKSNRLHWSQALYSIMNIGG